MQLMHGTSERLIPTVNPILLQVTCDDTFFAAHEEAIRILGVHVHLMITEKCGVAFCNCFTPIISAGRMNVRPMRSLEECALNQLECLSSTCTL